MGDLTVTGRGPAQINSQPAETTDRIEELNDLLGNAANVITGRDKFTGKPLGRAGRVRSGADLVTKGVLALNNRLFELASDSRMKHDLRTIAPEIEARLPPGGGVLVARYVGQEPNGAGNYYQEYIGLEVLGSGQTPGEAVHQLNEGRAEAKQRRSQRSDVCLPDAPQGYPAQVMTSDPPGRNSRYQDGVSKKLLNYRRHNPENKSISLLQGAIANAYYEEQLFFVGAADLARIKMGN